MPVCVVDVDEYAGVCCGCGRVCRCMLCGCLVGVDEYAGVCCVGVLWEWTSM